MLDVQFVLPFPAPIADRFARAVAALPGVRFGLISQEPIERLSPEIRRHVAGHWQVGSCFDPDQLAQGVAELGKRLGKPDRLLGVLEQLQEPLGAVRDALGIPGMSRPVAANFRDKARMKSVLRDAGVPCARHALAEDAAAVWSLAQVAGFPLVVKPPAGAGAKATFRLDSAEQLARGAGERPARARPAVDGGGVHPRRRAVVRHRVDRRPPGLALAHPLPADAARGAAPARGSSGASCCRARSTSRATTTSAPPPSPASTRSACGPASRTWSGSAATTARWRSPRSARVRRARRSPASCATRHDFDFYDSWARLMVFETFTPPARKYAAGAAFLRGQGDGPRRRRARPRARAEGDGPPRRRVEPAEEGPAALVELRRRGQHHRPPPRDAGGRRGVEAH